MPAALRELRQSVRLWARQPLLLLTSIGVLAIGLGATLTIFGIVNGLLLRPISPDHAERLVAVYSHDTTQPDSYRPFSLPNYLDVRGDRSVFEDVLAHRPTMVGITEGETTRRAFADIVSANFFATLRAPLARGRAFTEQESAPGADIAVVVISDMLFNRLGRPADVPGRTIRIDGRDYTVVGVARPGFTGVTAVASPELWLPLGCSTRLSTDLDDSANRPLTDRTNDALFLIGRLQPGVSVTEANRLLESLSARMAADQPDVNAHQALTVARAPRMSIGNRPPNETGLGVVAALLVAVATLVLVIACLNVATLLLSRGMARRRDVAVRLALGASRGRIVRQLLVEGFAVATLACAVGFVLAQRAIAFLAATIQAIAPLPIVFGAGLDGRIIAATLGWTAFSTVVFALGPAWKLSRVDIMDDLQRRPMPAWRGVRGRWRTGTNLLVVAQIALSLVLLTTAGLFLRGAARSLAAPLGFALESEAIASIEPGLAGYDRTRSQQMNLSVVERARATPSVESASLAATVPFGDTREGAKIAPTNTARPDGMTTSGFNAIGRDYFRTLRIPLVAGRDFTAAEERGAAAAHVAIVDQSAAKRLWPGEDAIGRTLYLLKGRDRVEPMTVVGVVGSIRTDVMDAAEPAVYVPFGQDPRTAVTIHVRVAAGSPASALPALRAAVASVNPRIPVVKLATMTTMRDESAGMWMLKTSSRIFGTLGLLAASLAVVGLYAVVAYVVSRRTKEIGIRIALGAASRDVLAMVLRDAAALTAAGLAIGLALSAASAQIVRSAASAVAAIDPSVFAVPPVLLALAALVAALVPARRAAHLAPLEALRDE